MLRDDVQHFLRNAHLRLNTDLGQHFLVEEEILEKILRAASIHPGERVLEIGPGIGILTRELLKAGAIVHAIEIDPRMLPLLTSYTTEASSSPARLHVTIGNALHTDIEIESPYKVVANIPYHITSPLLHRFFFETPHRPTSLTLLVQQEVAQNICANTTESILTVLTQLFGTARYICDVPERCFLPPPTVQSAVINVEMHPTPLADAKTSEKILGLVKHAMSHRRKMLRRTIGTLPGGILALERAAIDPVRRPETLTIHEWIALEQALLRAA